MSDSSRHKAQKGFKFENQRTQAWRLESLFTISVCVPRTRASDFPLQVMSRVQLAQIRGHLSVLTTLKSHTNFLKNTRGLILQRWPNYNYSPPPPPRKNCTLFDFSPMQVHDNTIHVDAAVAYVENIFGVAATMGKITNRNNFMNYYSLLISHTIRCILVSLGRAAKPGVDLSGLGGGQ